MSGHAPGRPHRELRLTGVWVLNLVVGLLAGAAFVAWGLPHHPARGPHVAWFVIAAAIAVCERWPITLHFRRTSHAFSLTDIPVTLALIFASGPDAVAGIALGAAAPMAWQRLAPVKIVFNAVQFVFAACLGLGVLAAVAGPEPEFGPAIWLGALLATQLGGVVTIGLISTVITITEGSPSPAALREMFGMDAVVTLTNTSLALLTAVVLVAMPAAIPILLVPVVVAFLGYRTYVETRESHEKLEFLYEANQTIAASDEVALALGGVLDRAREAFRVELAEIVLFGEQDDQALRTRLGPGDSRCAREPVDLGAAAALRKLAETGPVVIEAPIAPPLQPLLGNDRITAAMATCLRGPQGVVGTILLANPSGVARSFEHDDLALLESLAANAGAALDGNRLEGAVAELRDLQQQLSHQAHHDGLTGLPNRDLFAQEAARAFGDAGLAAVLFVDLDDFKAVNDMLGHAAGDQLLCAAAVRLSRAVRAGDLVARLGGDEFGVLLRTTTGDASDGTAAAAELAQRILNAFELPVLLGDRLVSVGLSVGIATNRHSTDDGAFLRDADMALRAAKAAGKGRYSVFLPEMRDAVVRRHALRTELAEAIDRSDLVVQYQPIVDLRTGDLAAVEALVRWDHPVQGRIPPLDFIPLAEETGLIVELGRVVLRKACEQAVHWLRAGNPPVDVQVNLSGRELDDPGLVANIAQVLRSTGLPPRRLVLEITETVLVQDAARGGTTLEQLRALGVQLALDDFGTGYSSLSYMRSLPLDVLKIAKEFVDEIAANGDDRLFVRLIAQLAAGRGLRVVAEGIETDAQAEVLRGLKCDLGQGYLFARPLDPDDPELFARPAAVRATAP